MWIASTNIDELPAIVQISCSGSLALSLSLSINAPVTALRSELQINQCCADRFRHEDCFSHCKLILDRSTSISMALAPRSSGCRCPPWSRRPPGIHPQFHLHPHEVLALGLFPEPPPAARAANMLVGFSLWMTVGMLKSCGEAPHDRHRRLVRKAFARIASYGRAGGVNWLGSIH